MRREVQMMRLQVIIGDDDAILKRVILYQPSLYDACQFRGRDIFPSSCKIGENILRQGQHRVVWAVAGE